MQTTPTIETIHQAAQRIQPYINRTPVLTCRSLNRLVKAELFFKCENFQKVGAFKYRGAANAVFSLSEEEAERGVATHSSGNHAAALALAAKMRGIMAIIAMPRNAPNVKRRAVVNYGGKIVLCESTQAAREETADKIVAETGATFIHPNNDYRIIAGQGTAALELLSEVTGLDAMLAPVGGGGLLSGTAIATAELSPFTKIIAAEPAGADDAYRSLKAGRIMPLDNPSTIADGLRTILGSLNFPIIQKYVHDIITVTDDEIMEAMRKVWEFMKIIIEPSSAVPVAVLLTGKLNVQGQRVGVILSGGNVDLDRLPWQKQAEI